MFFAFPARRFPNVHTVKIPEFFLVCGTFVSSLPFVIILEDHTFFFIVKPFVEEWLWFLYLLAHTTFILNLGSLYFSLKWLFEFRCRYEWNKYYCQIIASFVLPILLLLSLRFLSFLYHNGGVYWYHRVSLCLIQIWPFRKLPIECKKLPKNWHILKKIAFIFFSKKLPKIFIF